MLTYKQAQQNAARKRWAGMTKKEISAHMSAIAKKPRKTKQKEIVDRSKPGR